MDPDHILFLDGNRYSTQFDQLGDPMPNCVYTAHDYALPGFVDGGPYPGVSRGQYVDRDRIEETFLARTEYMRDSGTPIWVGEFGPVYTGDPEARRAAAPAARGPARDLSTGTTRAGRCGPTRTSACRGSSRPIPRSEYMTPDRAVPREEEHASAWTPGDRPTRACATSSSPSRQLFREEFPDFQPYPWGAPRWIHGHVRHVMLAEAMVGEFARSFAGVGPDDAERLADAFAFENCIIREPLAAILRQPGRAPSEMTAPETAWLIRNA